MKTVFLLLSAAERAKADKVILPTLLYFKTETTTTSNAINFADYVNYLKQIWPVDVSILLCLIFFIIVLLIYLYYKCRKQAHFGTKLKLEVGNENSKLVFAMGSSLKHSPEFYRFEVTTKAATLLLHDYYFTSTLQWLGGLQVTNIALEMAVQVEKQYNLSLIHI